MAFGCRREQITLNGSHVLAGAPGYWGGVPQVGQRPVFWGEASTMRSIGAGHFRNEVIARGREARLGARVVTTCPLLAFCLQDRLGGVDRGEVVRGGAARRGAGSTSGAQ